MAKAKATIDDVKPLDGFTPAGVFGDEGPVRGDDAPEVIQGLVPSTDAYQFLIDNRDAEIAALRAELATYKQAAPLVAGGRFTLSWKDGPTVTIDVAPGERPEDALQRYGVHSVPHKVNVVPADAADPCGLHSPGGVRPFGGSQGAQAQAPAPAKG